VPDFGLGDWAEDPARAILLRKHRSWGHEKEHRVLQTGDHFIPVKIREVIFGIEADKDKKELLTEVAKKFNPRVKVSQMGSAQLDTGLRRRYVR
jgi:hypothetical protein